jgi:hypothetical protein
MLQWEALMLEPTLHHIWNGIVRIMASLEQLTAEVSKNRDVMASAVALLTGLSAQIKAAGTDQTALDALTNSLDSNTNALAAAVTLNTPVSTASGPSPANPPPVSFGDGSAALQPGVQDGGSVTAAVPVTTAGTVGTADPGLNPQANLSAGSVDSSVGSAANEAATSQTPAPVGAALIDPATGLPVAPVTS